MSSNQKERGGISLRTVHFLLIVGAVIVSILMFLTSYRLSTEFESMTETSERQIELRKAELQSKLLRARSDEEAREDSIKQYEEAFEKVLQVRRSNNKLNLAFSSRCFETFLLQFFEYNTIPFLKSECDEKKNGKTRYFNCCLDNAVLGKACDGDKCINGYARKHGYWKNSKNGQSFSFINNLWQGIFNSHRLKWNSLATVNPMEEVYKRNPYLDTYRLVLRLLGCHSLEHGDIFCHKIGNGQYHYLQRKGNTVIFKNESKVRMTIPQSRISIMKVIPDGKPLIDLECQVTDDIAEIEVMPNEEYLLVLNDLLVSDNYYLKILWNEDYYFCAMEEGISNDFDMSNFDLSTC